jgi:hypothetical protein
VTTVYSVSAVITGTGYAIKPLLSYIVFKLILEQPGYVREVPIPSEFFYDVTASPAYEITYLVMLGAIYLRVCLCVSQLKSLKTVLDHFTNRLELTRTFSVAAAASQHISTFYANLLMETRKSSSKNT